MARNEPWFAILCAALSCGTVPGPSLVSGRAIARSVCDTGRRFDQTTEKCRGATLRNRFQWPAAGRMVTTNCVSADGKGAAWMTLALSRGALIYAVESGRVAYTGKAIKGFDDVILIRHDDHWVSAYALSGAILVKRNDVVTRGQPISRIEIPDIFGLFKLHFELRHGSVIVDPLAYLEKSGRPPISESFCG